MSTDGQGDEHSRDGAAGRSRSFGAVAGQYEEFRPGPPLDAVRWLFPARVGTVVDLGAGTGALSRLLGGVASDVVAVEPDPEMRRVLTTSVPGIEVLDGKGEALPLEDDSADGVVASSSWHWIEPVAGLGEAARALRDGGVMAALWTGPDPNSAFMQQAQSALSQDGAATALQSTVSGAFTAQTTSLEIPAHLPFDAVEHERFSWILPLTAEQIIGLLGTLSWVIVMEEADRQRLVETARRLLRDFLGLEGDRTVDVGYACEAYKARRSVR